MDSSSSSLPTRLYPVFIVLVALLAVGCPPDPEPGTPDAGQSDAEDVGRTFDTARPAEDAESRDATTRPRDTGPGDADRTQDSEQADAERHDAADLPPEFVEPSAAPSEPSAEASVVVPDPETATTVIMTATNLDSVPRLMRLGLTTVAGGRRQSTEQPPVMVDPGQTTTTSLSLRSIGVVASTLELPARITPRVIVEDETGALVERVYGAPFLIGPPLATAFPAVLAASNLQPGDLATNGFGTFQSKLVAAEKSDVGLEDAELLGPGEDGGTPLPSPNYADGVPDAMGMYHYNICLRWPVAWVDAGFGEDYGVEPEGAWRARGGYAQVKAQDDLIFDGNLDPDGCTGMLATPHKTDFWVVGLSVAQINGNTVVVRDANGDIESWARAIPYVGGSGTKHYTLPETNGSNLLAAATFTLARWNQLSGETITLNDRCEPDNNQCCDCANSRGIWINRRDRKFLIAHEMGHRILALFTGGYVNDCTKVITPSDFPCAQADSTSHALTSNEWSSCAAMEGWAHFVGVRAFNNHLEGSNPGASFRYWGGSGVSVDVEQGPLGGVDKFFETQCANGAALVGSGVELDWVRHWWDYHTNPSPEAPVTQLGMMQELNQDSGWTSQDFYQVVSDAIEAYSGAAQRARWEAIAAGNGVDH